ncbi:MAG: glycosyltransferase family 39 protein, partial [Candidatus Aminicenantales bacterium]
MSPKKKTSRNNSRVSTRTKWIRSRWAELALAALMLAGFGLRMIDLTDPPLDFHPTRQFRGAVVARSIYYQLVPSTDPYIQQQAVSMRNSVSELEPPILETIVAFGYWIAGGEYLWIARIIVSMIWVLAAIPLFALVRSFTSPPTALISVAYYLFLPFGVQASRSFQPDPLMVALLILGMFTAYRWSQTRTWSWVVWTGLVMGWAILIKAFAVYFTLGILLAAVVYSVSLRAALRD